MFTTKIKIIEHIKYVCIVRVCVCMVRNLYYPANVLHRDPVICLVYLSSEATI
ncbi:hypothetical protein HanIR_Chr03g0105791 [Helianthus annuus]|nr:hypothetical protein HanIR_Chr03g0105791 [Helianthus annuus]